MLDRIKEFIENNKRLVIAIGAIVFVIIGICIASSVSKKNKEKAENNAEYRNALSLISDGRYDESFELMSKTVDNDVFLQYKYSTAKNELVRKNYSLAIKLFEELDGYSDSDEMIKQCYAGEKKAEYEKYKSKYESKEYELALNGFLSLGDYESSKEYVQKCKDGITEDKYNQAQLDFENEQFGSAKKAFEELAGYKNSNDVLKQIDEIYKTRYTDASQRYEDGSYDEAIKIYQTIIEYKDSQKCIEKCNNKKNEIKYIEACEKYDAGNYDEALKIFTSINGFKDSSYCITLCKTRKTEKLYEEAVKNYKNNKTSEALSSFKSLSGFMDSDINILKCNLINSKKGDIIYFGEFEQDNNTGNGKEKIGWIVLKIENNKMLLLSEKVLDSRKFYEYNQSVRWGGSDLRTWLNGTFYNSTFDTTEKKIIQNSYLTDSRSSVWGCNPGDSTYDYVFCLSNSEIKTNLNDYSKWRAQPTQYAVAQGCKTNADGMCTAWWLRTPGWDGTSTCAVRSSDSSIDEPGYYVYRDYVGVRPAMWLDLRIEGYSAPIPDKLLKTTPSPEPTETLDASTTVDPTEIPDITATPEPTVTPEPTSIPTPTPTATPSPTPIPNKTSKVDSDGVSKDLKEFFETYEAFLDEYGAFMKRYMEACFSFDFYSLEDEYEKMEKKMEEFEKKMDALDPDIMSVADVAYYWDAIWRIEAKMLSIFY